MFYNPAYLVLSFLASSISSKFFHFYNQSTRTSSATHLENMNYALLNSDVNPTEAFSICSSLNVQFIRDDVAFFAIARKNTNQLWMTFLLILEKGFSEPKYSFWFYALGTTYVLPGSVNSVKMHAWNHVCISFDLNSGWMIAVVNGEVVHDKVVEELKDEGDIGNLRNRLFLGLTWKGGSSIQQSEGGVEGLQIYNEELSLEVMKEATSWSVFPKSSLLSWDPLYWTIHGNVSALEKAEEKEELTLFPKVKSLDSCVKLCSKVQRGGQVPSVASSNQSLHLVDQFKRMMTRVTFVPSAYSDERMEGHFENIYTRAPINMNLFAAGEPNGELSENCVAWSVISWTMVMMMRGTKMMMMTMMMVMMVMMMMMIADGQLHSQVSETGWQPGGHWLPRAERLAVLLQVQQPASPHPSWTLLRIQTRYILHN